MLGPVKVYLLTLWVIDNKYSMLSPDKMPGCITNGIWQVCGVEEKEDHRIYNLICLQSYHKDIKVGDKKKMHEDILIYFCHEVKIVDQPKLEHNIK
jgi:hypothetical protein